MFSDYFKEMPLTVVAFALAVVSASAVHPLKFN